MARSHGHGALQRGGGQAHHVDGDGPFVELRQEFGAQTGHQRQGGDENGDRHGHGGPSVPRAPAPAPAGRRVFSKRMREVVACGLVAAQKEGAQHRDDGERHEQRTQQREAHGRRQRA